MSESCSNCYFVRQKAYGYECHYGPPNPLTLQGQKWAQVEANDWCGEYSVNGQAAAPAKSK